MRLGVLIDNNQVPAWAYHAIERLVNTDYAEIALVINTKGSLDKRGLVDPSGRWHGWGGYDSFVYDLFCKLDRSLFYEAPDAFDNTDLFDLIKEVPSIHVDLIPENASYLLSQTDTERIKSYDLDLLVNIGAVPLAGALLDSARFGVWAYHHGDFSQNHGSPPGFWEVVEKRPETGVCLIQMSQEWNQAKVLYKARCFTHPFSPARNWSDCAWLSASFLSRQVERLYRAGPENFYSGIARFNRSTQSGDQQQYGVPSNGLALRLYTKLTARIVAETIQRKYKQFSWYLLYDLTENEEFRFQEFQPILPPKDRFWADPHILRVDDRYYIFIEEYLYKAGKGHISVIELEGKGRAKEPVRVLERDYHLSYPHVFEWQGRWYMVPESAEKRCIDLFECVEFPYHWTHKQRLMDDVIAFDSTLLHYEGKWWLFTALSEHEGAVPQVEFFLFYSQDLLTDKWRPHPQNPIISDAKCARPAGKVFIKNGEIFRPSQDCTEIYGSGFDLNQIVRLSESEYKEQKVVSVKPTWDDKILGTHTYAREGRLTVIDALTRRNKLI